MLEETVKMSQPPYVCTTDAVAVTKEIPNGTFTIAFLRKAAIYFNFNLLQ